MKTPEEIADAIGDQIGYRDRKEAHASEILGWLEDAARMALEQIAPTTTETADQAAERIADSYDGLYEDLRSARETAAYEGFEAGARAALDVASLATTHADRLEAAWESGDLASAVRDAIGDLRVIAATLRGEDI